MPTSKDSDKAAERRRREELRVQRKQERRRRQNKGNNSKINSNTNDVNSSNNNTNRTINTNSTNSTNNLTVNTTLESTLVDDVDVVDHDINQEELHNEAAMLKQAVLEHAEYLGIDPIAEPELLHIAEESMLAQPPPGWRSLMDENGNAFYYNEETKESHWEHPEDEHYRQLIRDLKNAKLKNAAAEATQKDAESEQVNKAIKQGEDETWDDWDEEEDDDGGAGSAPTTTGTGNTSGTTTTNELQSNSPKKKPENWDDWDSDDDDDRNTNNHSPIPDLPARRQRSPMKKKTNEHSYEGPPAPSSSQPTLVVPAVSNFHPSSSNITATSNATITTTTTSDSDTNDLARQLFQTKAETKELRAEVARVHALLATQKAEDIRSTQQNEARIRILQNEITNERSISSREISKVHELERQVKDLTDERDTFKDLYDNALKDNERKEVKPPDSPGIQSIEDIEKIAAAAQIAALEGKVSGLEEENEELNERVVRAMKMAREAQTAERELEETLETLRDENAKMKEDLSNKQPSPVKMNANALKQQQEAAVERAKQSTESRMKLEHNRAITKLRSEHASTTRNLRTQLKDISEKMEKMKQASSAAAKDAAKVAETIHQENDAKTKIILNDKNDEIIKLKSKLLMMEKEIEKKVQVATQDSERRRRQVEQCLSMAEERADRAEAEAHIIKVESQLASTLGIRVYELEREKDMNLLNVSSLKEDINQYKLQIKEAAFRHEKISKELKVCQAERSHLEVRNISLSSELRRLNTLSDSAILATSTSNTDQNTLALQNALIESEQRNAVLERRAAENEIKNESTQKVLQRLVL